MVKESEHQNFPASSKMLPAPPPWWAVLLSCRARVTAMLVHWKGNLPSARQLFCCNTPTFFFPLYKANLKWAFLFPPSVDNVMHSPTHPDWPRLSLSVRVSLKFAANRSVSKLKAALQAASHMYSWSSYICYKPYAKPAQMNEKTPIHRKLLPNNVLLNWEAFKHLCLCM